MIIKLVPFLVSLLGNALLVGSTGLVFLLILRGGWLHRGVVAIAFFVFGWLLFWTLPVLSDGVPARIDASGGPRVAEVAALGEVIFNLGGGMSGVHLLLRLYPNLSFSFDRIWYAAELFKAGHGSRIVLSDGVAAIGDESEAKVMRDFLVDLGVPERAAVLDPASGNTLANAWMAHQRLPSEGDDRIILVPSALHMPLARRIFDSARYRVIPAPTNFLRRSICPSRCCMSCLMLPRFNGACRQWRIGSDWFLPADS